MSLDKFNNPRDTNENLEILLEKLFLYLTVNLVAYGNGENAQVRITRI